MEAIMLCGLLLVCSNISLAQLSVEDALPEKLISNLYSADYAPHKLEDRNTIDAAYIIMTEKKCAPCFVKLEEHIGTAYSGFKMYMIVVLEDNPLLIRQAIQEVQSLCYHLDDIFFLFKSEAVTADEYLNSLIESPSPFFLVFDHTGTARMYSYAQSMDILNQE